MNQEKNIIRNGGYDADDVIWHAYSPTLMLEILTLFRKEIPVFDLGCGLNNYVNILNHFGYNAMGFDFVDLGSKKFMQQDITKPMESILINMDLENKTYPLNRRNVISLEVGEHIPYDICGGYLQNLCSFDGDIIMSWAVPGQAGIGHVNCQTNEWVIEQMEVRGYTLDKTKTNRLRWGVRDCHCSWFRNTLMYFSPSV